MIKGIRDGKKERGTTGGFKISAEKVILDGDMIVKELSNKFSIKDSTLLHWVQEYEEIGDDTFPGNESSKASKDYRVMKPKKRAEGLERKNELLKKSPVFMSQDSA